MFFLPFNVAAGNAVTAAAAAAAVFLVSVLLLFDLTIQPLRSDVVWCMMCLQGPEGGCSQTNGAGGEDEISFRGLYGVEVRRSRPQCRCNLTDGEYLVYK